MYRKPKKKFAYEFATVSPVVSFIYVSSYLNGLPEIVQPLFWREVFLSFAQNNMQHFSVLSIYVFFQFRLSLSGANIQ